MGLRSIDPFQQAKKFLGHPKAVNIISESGLYDLIMRAQKANPKAREFQNWVTGTVLPAIRKDGRLHPRRGEARHGWDVHALAPCMPRTPLARSVSRTRGSPEMTETASAGPTPTVVMWLPTSTGSTTTSSEISTRYEKPAIQIWIALCFKRLAPSAPRPTVRSAPST
nr:BRO family protein [Methylobacterium gossipiicola]